MAATAACPSSSRLYFEDVSSFETVTGDDIDAGELVSSMPLPGSRIGALCATIVDAADLSTTRYEQLLCFTISRSNYETTLSPARASERVPDRRALREPIDTTEAAFHTASVRRS